MPSHPSSAPAAGPPNATALLPTGTAPFQALAKAGRDGRLEMKLQVVVYKMVSVPHTETGKPMYYAFPSFGIQNRGFGTNDFQAYDVKGEKIDPTRLQKLLREKVPVLVSSDGKPVDPLHLRVIKDGTIILVIPKLAKPVAPPPGFIPVPAGD